MIWIYFIGAAMGLALAFMVYYSKAHVAIKATAMLAYFTVALLTFEHYIDQLGKPIEGYPDGKFLYVHHLTNGVDIKLWATTEDLGHRLYKFPHTQEHAQKLQAAQDGMGGLPKQGEFTMNGGNSKGNSPGLRIDDFRPSRDEIRK